MYSEKSLKNYIKLFKESISRNVADLFYSKNTQGALGHSRGTRGSLKEHLNTLRALEMHSKSTERALGHSRGTRESFKGHLNTLRALERHSMSTQKALQAHSRRSSTWALEGQLGTWALGHSRYLGALGHSSIWALGHMKDTWALRHSGTWALGHLGTRGTRGTLFSRLSINMSQYFLLKSYAVI